jgi:uncharacterized protein with HEPN domain
LLVRLTYQKSLIQNQLLRQNSLSGLRSIGNRIRHEYFRLDDAILWAIITNETHALKAVMESMLARHAPKSGA